MQTLCGLTLSAYINYFVCHVNYLLDCGHEFPLQLLRSFWLILTSIKYLAAKTASIFQHYIPLKPGCRQASLYLNYFSVPCGPRPSVSLICSIKLIC